MPKAGRHDRRQQRGEKTKRIEQKAAKEAKGREFERF
jgi:hypothetical protein